MPSIRISLKALTLAVPVAAAAFHVAPGAANAQVDDYASGQALSRAGKAAEAIEPLERASRARPGDADVWLGLGSAYAAIGRLDEADRALDEALRLAPGYGDVQLARARVAFFRGDLDQAQARLDPLLLREPSNEEGRALGRQIAQARSATVPLAWRVDAAVSRGDYSAPIEARRTAVLAISRSLPGGRFAGGSIEHLRQFGVTDDYLEAQLGGRRGYFALGATPSADFRPRWLGRVGLVSAPARIAAGWTAQLGADAQWARYPVGDVRSLQPYLTLSGPAVTLTARWYSTLDERNDHRAGYGLRGTWRAVPKVEISAAWTDAPESDQGATVPVEAASAGAAFDLSPSTTLRATYTREMRKFFDVDEMSLGFTRRF